MLDNIQRYESYLVEKRKLEEKEKGKIKKMRKQKEMNNSKLNVIFEVLKRGLEVAEQSIIEGNNAFAGLLKSQSLDMQELACVQSKIDMGLKRKIELNKEIIELENKKSKLEK